MAKKSLNVRFGLDRQFDFATIDWGTGTPKAERNFYSLNSAASNNPYLRFAASENQAPSHHNQDNPDRGRQFLIVLRSDADA